MVLSCGLGLAFLGLRSLFCKMKRLKELILLQSTVSGGRLTKRALKTKCCEVRAVLGTKGGSFVSDIEATAQLVLKRTET